MKLTSKVTRELSELPEAKEIRRAVFIEEQGFVNEFDEIDSRAVHGVIYANGEPAAAGRAFFENGGKDIHIGRICVLKKFRGQGLGAKIVLLLESEAVKLGAEAAVLSAQVRAEDFYIKLGYIPFGDEYLDEYCPHISMRKELNDK